MYEKELTKLLKQIANTDKTPEYEYYSKKGKPIKYLNADGEAPKTGQRWCTPREICNQYLRDIKSGKLEEVFRLLMTEDA